MMSDKEFVLACKDTIESYSNRTHTDYDMSVLEFSWLSLTVNNTFQQVCMQAAYFALWEPDTLNLCCLFE